MTSQPWHLCMPRSDTREFARAFIAVQKRHSTAFAKLVFSLDLDQDSSCL